jgi:cytochrome d ubiquinol oxidase subunit I
MFPLDAFHLARAQFAFTLIFHIVFPAFSIGLASYLAVLEGLWLRTGQAVYLDLFRYWVKIFSIGFAMGVVSGLVMSYQFGTNWAAFSDRAGPVIGPLMGYEVLTAFFLEAGFLGVMLFGMQKVGPRLHFAATCLVALGTLISATWILSVNSWMQTPRGYTMGPDGRFLPADWWAIIFNPSFFVRLPHMVLASYLSVAFVVGAVGAYHLLRDRMVHGPGEHPGNEAVRKMFSMAMWMAAIVAPAQIVMGDIHGLNTLHYQPAKIAAMEGDWTGQADAPEILFGIPDMQAETTRYKVELPYAGSLILTHTLDGRVPGLKDFPRADRPDSTIVFFTFRGMIAIGFMMAGIGLWSLFLRWRRSLFDNRWLQRAVLIMGPSGFAAVILGWITTEVGRQPFTVYGLMRTADSMSPIGLPGVATSLVAFIVVYAIVYAAGIGFLLHLMGRPPVRGEPDHPAGQPIRTAGLTPGPAGAVPEHADPGIRGQVLAE